MSVRARQGSASSTQTRSASGAFESVQSITFPAPVVDRSADGARRLGEVYWREVERSTLGVVRPRFRPDGLDVRPTATLDSLRGTHSSAPLRGLRYIATKFFADDDDD